MSRSAHEPPSYESTFPDVNRTTRCVDGDNVLARGQHQTHGKLLHDQLRASRTRHINDIITTHIFPCVHSRVSRGLSRTSIALLPTNITSSLSENNADLEEHFLPPAPKLIGIVSGNGDDDDLQQIQLSDPMDTVAFWSQEIVLADFRRLLEQRLESSIELSKAKPEPTMSLSPNPPVPAQQVLSPPKPKSRGLFSRKSSSMTQQHQALMQHTLPAAVFDEEHKGRISVLVQPEEICLRTQTEFGIYATLTRQALIVKVAISD